MRKKWFSLGCLTSFILLLLFLFLLGRGMAKLMRKTRKKQILPNSTLYLNLKGSLPEYAIINEDFFGKKINTVHSIVEAIKAAKKDPNISNIFISSEFLSTGYVNISEITNALKDFKKSGKKVYAYLELASTKDYLLSSVADKIYLNPSASAGILLKGIGINSHFYKTLFDKIGIEVKVIHAGKYKGYGENYSRTGFSQPVRKNLDIFIGDFYNQIINDIAKNRKLKVADLKNIFENRNQLFINKDLALKSGLVDKLNYKENIFSDLGITKKTIVNISSYNKRIHYLKNNNKIAVVYAEGAITTSIQNSPYKMNITSKRYNKIFKDLQKDNTVKAVVIRVNSPGGSALESEIILNAIKKLKKVKPVVVCMGNVAASGGYYISSNADYIIAEDYTITGSIGVVAMLPNIKKLADKAGVNTDTIKRGNFVGLFDPMQKPSDEAINLLRKGIQDTYLEFKTRVSEGRKIPVSKVEEVAQGQVWDSQMALKYKLIDSVGSLNDAIIKAAELAKTTSYAIDYFPKSKSYFQYLMENKFNLDVISNLSNTKIAKDLRINDAYETYEMIKENPIQMLSPVEIN